MLTRNSFLIIDSKVLIRVSMKYIYIDCNLFARFSIFKYCKGVSLVLCIILPNMFIV